MNGELKALDGIEVLVCIAVAWECPFEGDIPEQTVLDLSKKLLDAGASELVIADTIGAANPKEVQSLMGKMVELVGADNLACHFHDTRAMGLANVYAAVEVGIRKFDASIAGLGGCPFAPGAAGNVATEAVNAHLSALGYETGLDQDVIEQAAEMARGMRS